MADFDIQVNINPQQAANGAAVIEQRLAQLEARGLAASRVLTNSAGRNLFTGLPQQAAAAEVATQRVGRSFQTLESRAVSLRSVLRSVFGTISAALVIREVAQLANSYGELQNKLRVVIPDQALLGLRTQQLFDIANRTRQAFDATVTVYSRTTRAVESLGISQQRVLGFTENLNKAVAISGATASEARAGLIQLSQGLGRSLGGDELRSITENLPVVGQVIAKSLGVSTAALKDLGAQGLITPEVIITAFEKAGTFLEDKFAKTVATPGQALQVLQNRFLAFVGKTGESSGVVSSFTNSILFLADNFEIVGRAASAAGIAIGVNFAVLGVGAAVKALAGLRVALATNPVGVIALGLGASIGLLVSFGDKIKVTSDGLANLQDVAVVLFQNFKEGFVSLGDFLAPVKQRFESLIGVSDVTFKTVLLSIARFLDRSTQGFIGFAVAYRTAISGVPDATNDVFTRAVNAMTNLIEGGIDITVALFKTLGVSFTNFGINIASFFRNIGAANVQLLKGNLDAAATFTEQSNLALAGAKAAFTNFGQVFGGQLQQQTQTVLIPELANTSKDGAKKLGEAIVEGFQEGVSTQVTFAQDAASAIFRQAEGRAQERDRAAKAKKAAEDAKKAADAASAAAENQIPFTTLSQGATQFFTEAKAQAQDFAAVSKSAFESLASAGETAFLQLLQNGKINSKALADTLVQEIQRIIVRFLILQAINAIGGGFGLTTAGGAAAGARASGGTVQPGRAYDVGERGPERFIPDRTGTILPASLGQQNPPDVNVSVHNYSNPEEAVAAALATPQGERMVLNIMSKNRGVVRRIL